MMCSLKINFFLYNWGMLHFCFWTDEKIQDVNQAIEEDKPPEEIRHEPYSLPSGFVWDTLDLLDPLIVSV